MTDEAVSGLGDLHYGILIPRIFTGRDIRPDIGDSTAPDSLASEVTAIFEAMLGPE
jgi:hypothetical protein